MTAPPATVALPEALPTFVPDARYSVEEWLAIEEVTGEKYEYHDGRLVSVRGMAGGTWRHALIGNNCGAVAFNLLKARADQFADCNTLSSDLRVNIPGTTRYVYSDLTIVCGAPRFDEVVPTAIVNPLVVFEVTSPSSRDYDENLKFDFYGRLDALREYVIVHQHRRSVEVRSRTETSATWRTRLYAEDDGGFALDALGGAEFPYADVYRGWSASK